MTRTDSLYDLLEVIEMMYGFIPEDMVENDKTWDDYDRTQLKEMYLVFLQGELASDENLNEESIDVETLDLYDELVNIDVD